MAKKDFEDLKKGDLVVYKLPGGKKSYGVYMDVQFSKTGDVAIVKDMLETPKKTIKVKMSNITSVMDNFLEGKVEPKSEALKIVQDAIEAGKNAVINCIPSKTADGSECIDLDAFVRETPTSVDIVVSRPITKVFTYTKKPNGDLASLRQFIGNFDNTVNDIFNVIRAKFIEFNAKWNKITDDSKDYVDAYLGRAFIDGMSEAVEDTGETPLENQATTQTTSNTKFRLTDESKTVNGIKLYRIEALKDLGFYGVKQGDKGGFVESEANLSQNLDSWIGDNACVYNKAFVGRNSFVGGNAIVNDRAQVKENTRVTDNAQVSGQSSLKNSDISGDAVVSGSVTVVNAGSKLVASGKTQVLGKVVIDGKVDITDKAKIDGTSQGIYLSNVKVADEAEIIEIVDHHKIGNIGTNIPINFRNMPLGCTGTILYLMFKEHNIKIPKKYAGLMMSAIISDTLLLTSPTTTDVDKEALEELSKIAGVNFREYGMEMFKAGSSMKGKTVSEIIHGDFKNFTVDNQKVGIGQVSTMSTDEIMSRQEEFISELNEEANEGYTAIALFVTDILKNGSYIFFNDKAKDIFSNSFGVENIEQGHFFEGLVSRKKQIVPKLMNYMDN